jgi:hypothetical protein
MTRTEIAETGDIYNRIESIAVLIRGLICILRHGGDLSILYKGTCRKVIFVDPIWAVIIISAIARPEMRRWTYFRQAFRIGI